MAYPTDVPVNYSGILLKDRNPEMRTPPLLRTLYAVPRVNRGYTKTSGNGRHVHV